MKKYVTTFLCSVFICFFEKGHSKINNVSWLLLEEVSFGSYPGINDTFGKAELYSFFNTVNPKTTYFMNGTFFQLDRDDYGTNVGFGMRTYLWNNKLLFGANLYYDFEHAWYGDSNEIGFGFEIFSSCYEIRTNIYLPFGKTCFHKVSAFYNDYMNNYWVKCINEYSIEKKYELEVGRRFCFYESLNMYLGLGAYGLNFKHDEAWGGNFRARLQYLNILYLDSNLYYDNLFDISYEFKVGIMQSLGELYRLFNCARQPVIRNGYKGKTKCHHHKANY